MLTFKQFIYERTRGCDLDPEWLEGLKDAAGRISRINDRFIDDYIKDNGLPEGLPPGMKQGESGLYATIMNALRESVTNTPYAVMVEYNDLSQSDLEFITEEHLNSLAIIDEGWREALSKVGRNIKNKVSDAVQKKADAVRAGVNKAVQVVSSDTGRKARSYAKTRVASFINACMTDVMKGVKAKFGNTYHIDAIKIQGMDRVLKNIKFGADDRFSQDTVHVFSCFGSGRFRAQLINNGKPVLNMVIAYEAALKVKNNVGSMSLESWIAELTSDIDDVQRGIRRLKLDIEGANHKYTASKVINLNADAVDILLVNDNDTANSLVQSGITRNFKQALQATINQLLGSILSKDSASGAKSAIDAHNRRTNTNDERNAQDNFNGRRNRQSRKKVFVRQDRNARRSDSESEEY